MPRHKVGGWLLVLALLALVAPVVVPAPAGALPAAPAGLAPDSTDVADNPLMTWDPVAGATSYKLQVSISPTFASTLYNLTTVNTTFAPFNALPTGTIYWRVAAVDGTGTGPYTDASFSRTLLGPDLIAPPDGTPVPLEFPGTPITFNWEQLAFAKSYILEVDDATDFIGPTTVKTAATSYTLPDTRAAGQDFYWRVRGASGTNGSGVLTEWSDTWAFQTSWLAQPGLVGPPDDTVNAITDVELEFTPVLGARYYELEVAKDVDFNTMVESVTVYGTRYSPAVTYDNGSYHWRVRAVDVDGHLGTWSGTADNPFSFTRGWSPTPTLVSPLATLSNTSVDEPIVFEWGPTGPTTTHNESHYEVQRGTDANFSPGTYVNCYTNQTTLMPYTGGSDAPGGCSGSFFTLEEGVTYYWRVRGIDAAAGILGLWSAIEDFTYLGPPPAQPPPGVLTPAQPETPANCPDPDCTRRSSPTFEWEAVSGADYYIVYLANDAAFTNVDRTWTVTNATSFIPREELPDNDAGQAYYWHVRSCDADPSPDLCSADPQGTTDPLAFAFEKRSEGVTLTAPADGATVANLPRFAWDDYLTTPGAISALRYRIQVATDPSFSTLVENRLVDQPFFTPWGSTYPEGPLWWRVRAVDGSLNELTWSETRTLTKSSPAPSETAPANGADVVGIPTFTWAAQAFAAEYVIEVYEDDPLRTFPAGNRIINQTTPYSKFTPVTALPVGQDYSWRIRREDGARRDGPWSAGRIFDVVATGVPTLLTPANAATLTTDDNVFTWTGVVGAASYRYERSDSAAFTSIKESRTTVMTAWAPYVAIPEGTWYWRVVALDAGDGVLGTSATRSFVRNTMDLPTAPRNLTTTVGAGTISATWDAPSHAGDPAFSQYRITLTPGGPTKTVAASVRSVTFNGVTNGILYTLSVVAVNSDGAGPAATKSVSANGCPGTPFSDVGALHPFCTEIQWLFDEGITTGTVLGDGRVLYKPAEPVTRQAMAAFLYRFDGEPAVGLTSPFFGDVGTAHPFYTSIQWMAESGNSTGTPNPPGKPLYKPADAVARQAMAAFLHRYAGDEAPDPAAPYFADVGTSHPFFEDIQWMFETGLSTGTPNLPGKPLYKPGEAVSRQAMAAFLYRFNTEILGGGAAAG